MEGEQMSDADLVRDKSVLTTCGGDPLAREALDVFNDALSSGKLDFSRKDFAEDAFVKVLKTVGIFGKLKGLLPARTSLLAITEVDCTGVPIYNETPTDQTLTARWDMRRRAETTQLAVQFVRVSTAAKRVSMVNCGLKGTTHNKDDLIEQEIIRLVKKFGFGIGKDARFLAELSLAKNHFEDTFAKKLIETACRERYAHNRDDPPRLMLDLRGNKIRNPGKLMSELREGNSAGGPVNVASTDEPEEDRAKATVVVNFGDACDRSPTPVRAVQRQPPPTAPPPRRASPPPRRASPAPRRPSPSPRRASPPRRAPTPPPERRSPSKSPPRRRRRHAAGGRDRSQSAMSQRNGSRSRGARDGGGRGGGRRGEGARNVGRKGARRGRRAARDRKGGRRRRGAAAERTPSGGDDSRSGACSDNGGRGGRGRVRAKGGRARRGGRESGHAPGGKRKRPRRVRRRARPPTESYSDSRDDYDDYDYDDYST